MSKSVKSDALRVRLNGLDAVWAGAPVRRAVHPIASKVFVGEDAINGDRG